MHLNYYSVKIHFAEVCILASRERLHVKVFNKPGVTLWFTCRDSDCRW